jgi:hypothetical protein
LYSKESIYPFANNTDIHIFATATNTQTYFGKFMQPPNYQTQGLSQAILPNHPYFFHLNWMAIQSCTNSQCSLAAPEQETELSKVRASMSKFI